MSSDHNNTVHASQPIAFLNGRLVPISAAHLHVFDLGVVGGTSVTEMARTFRHVAFRLDEHLQRLAKSLELVEIDAGLTLGELSAICDQVVGANARLIPAHHDLGLIVFVTAGLNPTYLGHVDTPQPTVCVHTFPLPFELWSETYDTGLHLVSVNTRSIPDDVLDPRIKHRSRLHWHIAAREARRIDSRAMAVLTDQDGLLTETATGNLCVVDGSTIITPSAHVLEGVSREFAAELAASLGMEFIHAPVTATDLAQADEAFLTSTPHCLLPVTRFNHSPIGSGQPGPVCQQLLDAWSTAVSVNVVDQMRSGAADRRSTPSK